MDERDLTGLLDDAAGTAGEVPLDGIRRRAASIRRRRRGLAGSAAVLALALVLPLAGGRDEDRSIVVTDESTTSTADVETSTTTEATTTTTTTGSTSTTLPPVGETPPGESPEQPPTEVTTTTEPCLGAAYRPECGPAYFTYDGPNLPATLSLSTLELAIPGATTRITADWHDPDFFYLECWWIDFGDGSPIVMAPEFPDAPGGPSGDCRTNEQPHFCERQLAVGNGPQPFDPAPGSDTVVVDHSYAPGTYEITFAAISAWTRCPTASDVTATLTITVP